MSTTTKSKARNADTTRFNALKFQLFFLLPRVDYTETTEHILSSSIETINTVGNVFFTENVSEFYQTRQLYKTHVCDSVLNETTKEKTFNTIKGALDYEYTHTALISNDVLKNLHYLYDLCKQIMEVDDEDIEAYRKEREKIEKGMSRKNAAADSSFNEVLQLQKTIDQARAKLKLE